MSLPIRSDIQQLRGIAILLVVAYHAGGIVPSGFIGVDVFFVISGFVISRSVTERVKNQSFSFADFMFRRVRRILPALAVMLFVVLTLSTWFSPILSRVQTVRTGIFSAVGGANGFLYRFRPDGYFVASEKSNALLHTWSLSLEEQFYFTFAVVVTLIVGLSKPEKLISRLKAVSILGMFASLWICIAASHSGVSIPDGVFRRILGADSLDTQFAFYMPFTRAWEFLAGCFFGFKTQRQSENFVISRAFKFGGLVAILLSALYLPSGSFPGVWSVIPVLGAVFVIAFGTSLVGVGTYPGRALSWLGDRSYSWYLWHWPVIQFTTPFNESRWWLAAAGLISLVPAAVSYHYVEAPFREKSFWKTPTKTLVIALASIVFPLIAMSQTRSPEPDLDQHLDVKLGCMYGDLELLEVDGPCTLRIGERAPTAALIGDSHASHLSEAFVGASHQLGFNAMLASRANKSFLYLQDVAVNGTNHDEAKIVKHLVQTGVSLVVLAQSTYQIDYLEGRTWADGMRPLLRALTDANIKVVLIAESVFVNVNPQDCSGFQIRISACEADVVRDSLQLRIQRGRVEQEIALDQELDAVSLFDSSTYLCPQELCEVRRDGRWWWRDNGHISVYASSQLAQPLQLAMAKAITG